MDNITCQIIKVHVSVITNVPFRVGEGTCEMQPSYVTNAKTDNITSKDYK